MAITANEKVLTLDYWKPARKLRVGDYVFDKDGNVVQIKLIQEYRSEDCYEVTFNDYLSMRGDQNLGFPTETPKHRKRMHEYKGKFKFRRPLKPLKVKDFQATSLKTKYNRLAFSVQTAKPLELPHQYLPVPPFIFGFWLFGRKAGKKFVATQGKTEEVAEKFKDHGYKLVFHKLMSNGERNFSVTPSIESQLAPNVPSKIPNNYLLASVEQRTELLKGILCAKHRLYSPKTDTFRYTSSHFGSVTQIQYLVESLGIKTKLFHDTILNNYVLTFKTRIKLVSHQVSPPVKVHFGRRFITSITPIPAQSCIHIETTGSDNTILVGEGFIPCL